MSCRFGADASIVVTGGAGFLGRVVVANGQPHRKLDVSRAESYFGFRSTTPFEVGLKRTVEWYRAQVARPAASLG